MKAEEWKRDITKNDFFFIKEDNYDEHIELAIPLYKEMHRELVRFADRGKESLKILDLGGGTGKTSYVLLKVYPKSQVKFIDLFDEMIQRAKVRLSPYESNVDYVKGDFMDLCLGEGYDICVASLSIHHQTPEGKRHLFSKVYNALSNDGTFLIIDWTNFTDPAINELAASVAEESAASSISNEQVVEEWCDHWRTKNIPDTVENICKWLHEAGFAYTECVVRYFGIALIYAQKTGKNFRY
ncbi:MAG: class I SAM-dependent methyltransferase [Candidatus Brocadiaceae bacterium]|nr:class I SAM-dependent methyltransferase [Candidatus Brocadiaceae bacterium]